MEYFLGSEISNSPPLPSEVQSLCSTCLPCTRRPPCHKINQYRQIRKSIAVVSAKSNNKPLEWMFLGSPPPQCVCWVYYEAIIKVHIGSLIVCHKRPSGTGAITSMYILGAESNYCCPMSFGNNTWSEPGPQKVGIFEAQRLSIDLDDQESLTII